MRFIIRADATQNTGAGHVMRTSVIAEELLGRGFEVIFVGTFAEIPWLEDHMATIGFTQILSPSEEFLINAELDILILDSYEIPASDHFIQRRQWNKVLTLVDDKTPPYIADIYIHSGLGTNWKIPQNNSHAKLFLGEEYILIRKSLRDIRGERNLSANSERKILVTGGGSDPFQFAQAIVKLLSQLEIDFEAFIVSSNFDLPKDDPRFQFIPMGRSYEELLPSLDLAITTAGTSSYEFLYLNIQIALASAIENQLSNHKYFVENNFALSIGNRNENNEWELDLTKIEQLLSPGGTPLQIAEQSKSIGQGHLKIVDLITD